MAHSIVFPYSITLEEDGGVYLFPAAEVGFPSKHGGWFTLFLLVDSGAVTSALPKSDAVAFGIDPEKGRQTAIAGIAGAPIQGWEHAVRIRLSDEILEIPILFVESPTAPRVLGREGVFDRFTIVFEEKRRRTGFLGTDTELARPTQEALDRLAS